MSSVVLASSAAPTEGGSRRGKPETQDHAARFSRNIFKLLSLLLVVCGVAVGASAQVVNVGAGSYTTALPAGNTAPQSTIYRTYSGPVATHKFWTAKNWNPLGVVTSNNGPYYMFPEPLSVQTNANGLEMGYFNGVNNNGTWFNKPFQNDLTLGVAGLNASAVNVSAFSDWTVDLNWGPMTLRIGRGMPFVYMYTNGSAPQVTFSGTPTVFANNGNVLGVSIGSSNYGLFCPSGGSWSGIGSATLTCNPPSGHNYFSLAILPSQAALNTYAGYAFSFPTNTQATYSYNQSTSQVSTTFTVTTQAMEGTNTGFLMALYPHQYSFLSGSSINTSYTYASPRGTMDVLSGTSFTTAMEYPGVLPFLPPTGNYNASSMQGFINTVAGEGNHFTDNETYGLGKQLNRMAQLLPITKTIGDTTDYNNFLSGLEGEYQTWFNAGGGKTSDLFYYDSNWGTLIGYPASYGTDTSLNDHHFHYGYWIHAAALADMFDPNFLTSSNYGGMIDLLRRDIAEDQRGDSMFPYLRYFDVYGGHSWAAGQAPFGDGGNEESSSEAVNAWVGLILYGAATGNSAVENEGIYLYTTEINSVYDYWFNDGSVKTFPSGFNRVEVANVFDAKSDTGTWFSAVPDLEHDIEFLPFTGGSLYLGRDPAYNQTNFNEIVSLDGGSFSTSSSNWPDLTEEYQAFYDPSTALNEFNSTSYVFDGETKAHEYYWLSNLQKLGEVDEAVTANTPLYAVFKNPSTGAVTHAAFNPSSTTITVNFSDGASLSVAPGTLQTDNQSFTISGGNGTTGTSGGGSGGGGTGGGGSGGGSASSVMINAGGSASGSWLADADFSGGNSASTTATIDTSLVSNPAPQAVYQTERWGAFTYTIGGLTAGGSYNVNLHFAEIYWTTTGQREFNVLINGTQVLTNFDIIAAAGAADKAIVKTFSATANASGQIVVQFTVGAADQPKVSGIDVEAVSSGGTGGGGGSTSGTLINSGGAASGSWVADEDYSGGSAASTTATIDTSLVSNPAPQAVYQTERWGASTYTIGGLTAGANYNVNLHFAEIYWTATGQREFNVIINGTQVLTNFDIIAAAGAADKAIVKTFPATANSSGQIVIQFTVGAADQPKISGIDVEPASNSASSGIGQAVSVSDNSGGGPSGAFIADALYSGGNTASTSNAIDTSLVSAPVPPQAVFQTERWGPSTYTVGGFAPNVQATVKLYFSENYWTSAGQRQFNVLINGVQVLTNFDILAAAGGQYKAIEENFTTTTSSSGQVVIQLTTGAADQPKISGFTVTGDNAQCGKMTANQELLPGQTQLSCDSRFTLSQQSDGNLVLYEGSTALWATGTNGQSTVAAIMQADGNLVTYTNAGANWASNTSNNPGDYLAIQTDGNMVIYNSAGSAIWTSNTCCH